MNFNRALYAALTRGFGEMKTGVGSRERDKSTRKTKRAKKRQNTTQPAGGGGRHADRASVRPAFVRRGRVFRPRDPPDACARVQVRQRDGKPTRRRHCDASAILDHAVWIIQWRICEKTKSAVGLRAPLSVCVYARLFESVAGFIYKRPVHVERCCKRARVPQGCHPPLHGRNDAFGVHAPAWRQWVVCGVKLRVFPLVFFRVRINICVWNFRDGEYAFAQCVRMYARTCVTAVLKAV